jgi:hypothetical protein
MYGEAARERQRQKEIEFQKTIKLLNLTNRNKEKVGEGS